MKISLTALFFFCSLVFGTTVRAQDNLWISILSHPPEQGQDALGIYVPCPSGDQLTIGLYRLVWPLTKVHIGDFSATYSQNGNVVEISSGSLVTINIDTTQSTQIAPFDYEAIVKIDPSVYTMTPYQLQYLSALIFNPAYPEDAWQPVWGTNLTQCPQGM